jgi:hypothetical protein
VRARVAAWAISWVLVYVGLSLMPSGDMAWKAAAAAALCCMAGIASMAGEILASRWRP